MIHHDSSWNRKIDFWKDECSNDDCFVEKQKDDEDGCNEIAGGMMITLIAMIWMGFMVEGRGDDVNSLDNCCWWMLLINFELINKIVDANVDGQQRE